MDVDPPISNVNVGREQLQIPQHNPHPSPQHYSNSPGISPHVSPTPDTPRSSTPIPLPPVPKPVYKNARGNYVEEYPGAGAIVGVDGETFQHRFENDETEKDRETNPYYPFKSEKEAELALLLDELELSAGAIDRILELEIVKDASLSFKTAEKMKELLAKLPPGPQWSWQVLEFPEFPTKEPIIVYYRDGLECLEALIADPQFASDLDVVPRKEYTDEKCTERVYSEYMTSDLAWETQQHLPPGAALAGVILSSDKTKLSQGTGNACAHPLTISTAAIKAGGRNALSTHAFMLAAFIPIPEFLDPKRKNCSTLEKRILHATYDLVSSRLKVAAKDGHEMTNALGEIRRYHTPLVSVMAVEDIGIDPNDIDAFAAACEPFHLNGVSQPFWRDWAFSDPYHFLTSDALHGLHKQFLDHDFKWAIQALGAEEMDFRYILIQPRIGVRHFNNGVCGLKQCTGREQRELQKSLVALIDADVPDEFVRAIRALMEFRYRSQSEFITDSDLKKLKSALDEFHQYKQVMITQGYRKSKVETREIGWGIPKLERLHYLMESVRMSGAPYQWSTDRTESAHIELVKRPYRRTNRRDYFAQICRILDRTERRRGFNTYIQLHHARIARRTKSRVAPPLRRRRSSTCLVAQVDEGALDLGELSDLEDAGRKITDYFADATRAGDMRTQLVFHTGRAPKIPFSLSTPYTAYHFKYEPDVRQLTVEEAATRFRLPDLYTALQEYYAPPSARSKKWIVGGSRPAFDPNNRLPFTHIKVWYTVRIQNYDVNGRLLPASTLQAVERLSRIKMPKGRFDTCLITNSRKHSRSWDENSTDYLTGHFVAQVRLLFRPVFPNASKDPQLRPHLAYVQRFDVVPQVQADKSVSPAPNILTNMYVLTRAERSDRSRLGGVVDIRNIRMPAELIPRFGTAAERTLNVNTAMERSIQFYLNKFSSKDLFFRLEMAA
ncbi:hypothetical protein SISNIDRAFT_408960 [Sistotremastrum niveocremeum HHB9708]|uniref:DUF6830 domain-containing protein n=1 Tax=Sistotremastrum niveocremeum HHB9708 TaxID=1314777 RepID=A0A164WJS4_9AGAM|nr:hypothetical protein SISNIDRAFT_408960 [Sistotremastrum niveocremeum HHB9708]